jgi:carboxylate-amine ligase
MSTPFTPSENRSSIGVEWELSLVDRETRDLVSGAPVVLNDICPPGLETHPYVKYEFMEYTVEVITGICSTVEEAMKDLSGTVGEVRAAANARGLELIAAAAHPFAQWRDQKITDGGVRYEQMLERQRDNARRLAITGVHIHVGLTQRDSVIPILNALRAQLGPLLALSASSPYWQGQDTGFASCRTGIFSAMSTAGLPPALGSWDEFEDLMDAFIAADAVVDMRQLWWDIRPHPDFGTIEIRIADCLSTLDEIGVVAAMVQCLVERYANQLEQGYTLPVPKGWIVAENKWRAARYGLDARFIINESGSTVSARDAIDELVTGLMPTAHRLGCAAELATATRILTEGTSSQRQRAVALAHGGDLTAVVDHLIAEMRDGLTREQGYDATSNRE